MIIQNKYGDGATTAMQDIVFFIAAFFFLMFALSVIYMNTKQPDAKKVDVIADFRVTTSWDKDSLSDVDTWLEDPQGHLVSYISKADGLMHLDRDDIGQNDDIIHLPNGDIIKYSENRENITIRGIVPGEYILNLHMFNSNGDIFPVKVKTVLYNVRQGHEEHSETVEFSFDGEEITAFRFTLTIEGEVTNINRLEKKYIGVSR